MSIHVAIIPYHSRQHNSRFISNNLKYFHSKKEIPDNCFVALLGVAFIQMFSYF